MKLPDWYDPFNYWSSLLAYANSAINPLVYTCFSASFRRGRSTRDQSISRIHAGFHWTHGNSRYGLVGIPWRCEVLLYSSVEMGKNITVVWWECERTKTLHFPHLPIGAPRNVGHDCSQELLFLQSTFLYSGCTLQNADVHGSC